MCINYIEKNIFLPKKSQKSLGTPLPPPPPVTKENDSTSKKITKNIQNIKCLPKLSRYSVNDVSVFFITTKLSTAQEVIANLRGLQILYLCAIHSHKWYTSYNFAI